MSDDLIERAGFVRALRSKADWLASCHYDDSAQDMRAAATRIEQDAATIAALRAELEGVRKDAERYRFIRDAEVSDDHIPELSLYAMESLDQYIDAAMADVFCDSHCTHMDHAAGCVRAIDAARK